MADRWRNSWNGAARPHALMRLLLFVVFAAMTLPVAAMTGPEDPDWWLMLPPSAAGAAGVVIGEILLHKGDTLPRHVLAPPAALAWVAATITAGTFAGIAIEPWIGTCVVVAGAAAILTLVRR